jgi:hypothetical protein
MKYKQLPLTGGTNDFANSINELEGWTQLHRDLDKFFDRNKQYNPRQLHYMINAEIDTIHLDELIDWGADEDKS